MGTTPLWQLSACDIAEKIASGEVSSRDAVGEENADPASGSTLAVDRPSVQVLVPGGLFRWSGLPGPGRGRATCLAGAEHLRFQIPGEVRPGHRAGHVHCRGRRRGRFAAAGRELNEARKIMFLSRSYRSSRALALADPVQGFSLVRFGL